MLIAVLSSGPFLNEWEMEFTCIISQHLGLAGRYLFCWNTLFWGKAESDIFGYGREENSVCVSALTKTSRTRSSQISSIIHCPLPIPSATIPRSLPLQPSFLRPP